MLQSLKNTSNAISLYDKQTKRSMLLLQETVSVIKIRDSSHCQIMMWFLRNI